MFKPQELNIITSCKNNYCAKKWHLTTHPHIHTLKLQLFSHSVHIHNTHAFSSSGQTPLRCTLQHRLKLFNCAQSLLGKHRIVTWPDSRIPDIQLFEKIYIRLSSRISGTCYPAGLSGRIAVYLKNRPDSRITGYKPDIRCEPSHYTKNMEVGHDFFNHKHERASKTYASCSGVNFISLIYRRLSNSSLHGRWFV